MKKKSSSRSQQQQEEEERIVLRRVELLKDELISLTQDLVRIPSVSGQEEEAQAYVHSKLKKIGFRVRKHAKLSSRPNLVASFDFGTEQDKKKKKKNLLFIAHIDNIPAGSREDWRYDPYSAKIVNGRIYGRGVADMKAGLAAMMIAAKAIRSSTNPNGTFSIASVVDEEVESAFGMKYLAEEKLIKADASIFGEPAFPDMVVALKGGVWVKLTTYGKKVGSGWPDGGVNAVAKMAKVLTELDGLDISSGTIKHPLLGWPTIAPGTTIRGGDMIHSIPDRCEATVDIYTVPGQSSRDAISKVKSLLRNLQDSDKDLSVKVEKIFETKPTITGTGEEIYVDLQSSVESVFGGRAKPTGIPSVGDARFMRELGIPTIVAYGPGERGKGHVVNESVSIETLVNVTKVYALTALRFWRS